MLEPLGFEWGELITDDGVKLRWGRLTPGNAKFECVLVGGFCEFIEKYFELIADLAARGVRVWCLDWRGQGGSQRPPILPNRPRRPNFARDVSDLATFVRMMGPKQSPRFVMAHSMGAAIALKMLATHPGLFDAGVLCAPMLSVATGNMTRRGAQFIAALADTLGFGRALIPGLRILDMRAEPNPETSSTSHDPLRCKLMHTWFRARPDLAMDGTTFSWYRGALDAEREFNNPSAFASLHMPILLGAAGQDVFVRTEPIRELARTLPDATLLDIPEARHELFHECDDIRDRWLAAIDAFLQARLLYARL
jgi:lysophospholipase